MRPSTSIKMCIRYRCPGAPFARVPGPLGKDDIQVDITTMMQMLGEGFITSLQIFALTLVGDRTGEVEVEAGVLAVVTHIAVGRIRLVLSLIHICGGHATDGLAIRNAQRHDVRGDLGAILKTIEPVSYTHLDVYKRQADGPAGRANLAQVHTHAAAVFAHLGKIVDTAVDLSLIHI